MHDDIVETATGDALDGRIATLFEEESARMWRSPLLHTADPEIARDAVAEAFAQLLRRGDEVRDQRAWVWRAAFRIADREATAHHPAASMTEPMDYELTESVVDLVRALRALSPNNAIPPRVHGAVLSPLRNLESDWRLGATFGHDVKHVWGVIESSFGFNLEVIVERTDDLPQHYWRDGQGWHEGAVIDA